jgi:hypothetical protein
MDAQRWSPGRRLTVRLHIDLQRVSSALNQV